MHINTLQRKINPGTRSLGPAVGGLVFLLIASLLIFVPPVGSAAKDWPAKPISLIVPWTAGGGTDRAARFMAPRLSKMLGVPIMVVNKPGASGITGTLEAVKSPPDGYTLLMDCNGGSSIQHAWHRDLPYKVAERTFIARVMYNPLCVIVPASSPWKTMDDLANTIRTNPSSISYGAGAGAPDVPINQFLAALAAKGVDVSKTRAVTFKGSGDINPAVAGGHLSFSVAGVSAINPLVSAGKVRPLAVSSHERYKGWPNVPTTAEAGYPTVNGIFWASLGGPPGLPAHIVKTLDDGVREILKDPEARAGLEKMDFFPFYLSTDAFKKFVMDEGESIKSLKLK